MMNIVDDFTRECLALEIGYSFGSADVLRVFDDIAFYHELPAIIRFDMVQNLPAVQCFSRAPIATSLFTSSTLASRPKMHSLNHSPAEFGTSSSRRTSSRHLQRPCSGGRLAPKLQRASTAFSPRLSHSEGVRSRLLNYAALTVGGGVNGPLRPEKSHAVTRAHSSVISPSASHCTGRWRRR